MPSPRACLGIPMAVILSALIAGCSSISSSATSTSASSPPASASPSASALNGDQLGAALLPRSDMPSGFKLDPSGERNTGASTASDTTQQVPASKECSLLTGTSWIAATGMDAGSFAQNDYINGSSTEEIAQEADAYSGGDAQHVMETLWEVFGKCSHFTVDSGGTSAATTMARSKLSGVGDQAYEAVQTSPAFQGGTTLVAIRVGNVIVTCLDSSSGNDKGSAALRYAERIATKVQNAM
jgi:hypothetical protein